MNEGYNLTTIVRQADNFRMCSVLAINELLVQHSGTELCQKIVTAIY